jgi:hypothetical protein
MARLLLQNGGRLRPSAAMEAAQKKYVGLRGLLEEQRKEDSASTNKMIRDMENVLKENKQKEEKKAQEIADAAQKEIADAAQEALFKELDEGGDTKAGKATVLTHKEKIDMLAHARTSKHLLTHIHK